MSGLRHRDCLPTEAGVADEAAAFDRHRLGRRHPNDCSSPYRSLAGPGGTARGSWPPPMEHGDIHPSETRLLLASLNLIAATAHPIMAVPRRVRIRVRGNRQGAADNRGQADSQAPGRRVPQDAIHPAFVPALIFMACFGES
ncbi:hypothetical protein VUR80DRAFT_4237 [Thermomyces stellatus]